MNSKQANFLFIAIFAIIAIMGFVSILSPTSSDVVEAEDQPIQTRATYSGYLFRVIAVTLAMVIFLIVGLRIYRKQIQLRGKNSINMDLLGRYYINDKQYLLKVAIDDRNLLLGVSEQSINMITELDLGDDDKDQSFGRILDLETNQERPA